MTLPKIEGAISVEDFQQAFKIVKERTSSSPSSLHYSIWKIVAREDNMAQWLSIMMSLPFMYGFVNKRWATIIDIMIEKKKDVRKIHQLRIIGILEADFNTALKILFAKKTNGPSRDQWPPQRPMGLSTKPHLHGSCPA